MATELATAYVTLVPSLGGAKKKIEEQLSGLNLSAAGRAAGSSLASGIASSVGAAGNAVSKAGSLFSSTFGTAAKVGVGAIAGIGTAVVGLAAKGGLTRALNLEQAQTMFKGLKLQWGDYEQTINDAVDGTAFSLDSAALVAAQLAASGVGAGKQMETALNACVGAAATFGRDLGDIGSVFQKVAAKGKLSGDELVQLNERGINAVSVLSEYLGKTQDEVSQMVSQGKIDFQTFSDAMYAAFGDSAQVANETFTGSFANMKSALSRIGADFMIPIKDGAIPVFNAVRKALDAVRKALAPVAEKFGELAERVSGKAAFAIERFTARLEQGYSITEALKGVIDSFLGSGTTQAILGVTSALGGLAALGPTLKLAGAGIQGASAAIKGLSSVGGTLASVASSVGAFVSSLGSSSVAAIKTFGDTLLYGLVPQGAFDAISSLSSDLAYGLKDCKRDLSDALSGVKDAIASRFDGIGEAIDAKLGGIPSKVGSRLSGLKTVMGEALGNAADAFRAKFSISSHAEGEGSKVSAVFSKLRSGAATLGGPLMTAAAGLTAVAGGLLVAGVAAVATGADVQGACNQFLANIQAFAVNLPVMAQQLAAALPALVEQVVAALPALVEAFGMAMMALVQVLPVVLPQLVAGITAMVQQLAPVLVTLVPLLLDAGLQLFTALLNFLSEIMPALIEMLPELVMQVCTALVNNMPLLLEAALTLFVALVTALVQVLPQLIAMLPQIIDQVSSSLIGFIPQLASAAVTLFTALVTAIPQVIGAVLSALGGLLAQLPGKVSSFAGRMGTAAMDMIKGMVQGIGDAAGWVVNKIGELCSNALDAVKGFFGIASPSKLMRKMFRFVGEGAVLGIDDLAGGVASAMGRLAEGAADAAKMAAPVIPVAFEAEEPPQAALSARSMKRDGLISPEQGSASNIDRLIAALAYRSDEEARAQRESTDRLAYILEAIYEVIPAPQSDWDFKRRVRMALNG